MRRGGVCVLLLACWSGAFAGCAVMEPVSAMGRYAKSLLTFRSSDYSNPTEEQVDPWIEEAGSEARAGRPRERDPDQWYKKYFMSEKARSIERNVGID